MATNRLQHVNQSLTGQPHSSIKLINSLVLPVVAVMLLQIPIALLYSPQNLASIVSITVISAALITTIPISTRCMSPKKCKWLLVVTYFVYIVSVSLLWEFNLNTHYFLLLGVFTFAFIFPRRDTSQFKFANALYVSGFVGLSVWFIGFEGKNSSTTTNTLRLINDAFFLLSALVCSGFVRHNNDASLNEIHRLHRAAQGLLENTLPKHAIQTLIKNQPSPFTSHEQATVLFADMSGYTGLCDRQSILNTVTYLDATYRLFDRIAEQHGMIKIKTNGDQYIAVAGLGAQSQATAERACSCAIELMEQFKTQSKQNNDPLGLRIGISTGHVVSGIIGNKTLCFDVWGPAVNMAALLESKAMSNKILVCEATKFRANGQFSFSQAVKLKDKLHRNLNSYYIAGTLNNESLTDL